MIGVMVIFPRYEERTREVEEEDGSITEESKNLFQKTFGVAPVEPFMGSALPGGRI